MGYLDKQSRVIDFVLTEHGRKLFSVGQLDFTYFALLDDGVDYDPWSTGSMTPTERELQVEALPMLEAPFIRDVRSTQAPLEPVSHLFTAAANYATIPAVSSPVDGAQLALGGDQQQDDGTYTRTGTSLAQIDLSLVGGVEPHDPGFIVRVFASGSNGLVPLDLRHDLQGRRAYDPFIAVAIDDEKPIDTVQPGDITRRASATTVKR
jgi:hypothetical protein